MSTLARKLVPALALTVAACSSGTTYVYQTPRPTPVVQQPAPQPPPPVVAEPLEPLEITIGRPLRDGLVVHTSRHAYVAIFELLPDQGVTLVHPSSPAERYFELAGLSTIRVWWTGPSARGNVRPVSSRPTRRFIYAIASDEPLRIPDEAFKPAYLRKTLGAHLYSAADPYATMRALSREFVPDVLDEEWAEDVYVLAPSRTSERQRVARVYCPGGARYEVPAEMADRVTCPRPANAGRKDKPARPDSVVGDDERRVSHRGRARGPVDRVKEPTHADNDGRGRDAKKPHPEHPDNPGRGHANGRGEDRDERREDVAERGRGVGPRGRDAGRQDTVARPTEHAATPADAGSGVKPPKRIRPEPRVEPPVATATEEKPDVAAKPEGETKPESQPAPGRRTPGEGKPDGDPKPERTGDDAGRPSNERREPKAEPKAEPKEEPKAEPRAEEPKPEPKEERKPEAKEERKPEAKEERKPEAKEERKPEPKEERKPEAKEERKPEAKEERKPDRKPDDEAKPAADSAGAAGASPGKGKPARRPNG